MLSPIVLRCIVLRRTSIDILSGQVRKDYNKYNRKKSAKEMAGVIKDVSLDNQGCFPEAGVLARTQFSLCCV